MRTTYLLLPDGKKTKRAEVLFSAFPDNDSHCVIEDVAAIKDQRVLVVHDLYPNQNDQVMKLLLLIDLLDELGAKEVSVYVPYLPYARQDKRHLAGEALSAFTLCKTLARAGVACLYTLDCHFMKGAPSTIQSGLHIKNYSLGSYLVDICSQKIGAAPFDVVGPDKGSGYLVEDFGAKSMHKNRGDYGDMSQGTSSREVAELAHDHLIIEHPTVVILDDMISTGGTLIRAVENLRTRKLQHIYSAATHGLFLSNSKATLDVVTDGVVVSDSIESAQGFPLIDRVLQEHIIPDWL